MGVGGLGSGQRYLAGRSGGDGRATAGTLNPHSWGGSRLSGTRTCLSVGTLTLRQGVCRIKVPTPFHLI